MRLACPSCGAVASLEAWTSDEDARRALAAVMDMPGELPRLTAKYLALFRAPDSKRGLAWVKALRLIEELREMAKAGEINWDGKTSACIPAHWMRSIEALLDRDQAGKVTRPLKNHNLLRAIVFERANREAAQVEAKREEDKRRQAMHRLAPVQPTREPADASHLSVGSEQWERNRMNAKALSELIRSRCDEEGAAPALMRMPAEESEDEARERLARQREELMRRYGGGNG